MAHRRGPRSPQRSIRGGIGRRPRLRGGVEEGPPPIDDDGDPRGPVFGGSSGGKIESYQAQVVRKYGGGKIKTKKK